MNPSAILAPDGLISAKLPGYEHRPQQLRMAELVGQAFVDKKHLIIEAGTGVGKSFAYLVPAIEMVHGNSDKRIVISTHTIALQEQLIEKDIPFLKKVFPDDFKAVLVKGRSNYVCLRRLAFASVHQDRLFGSERELKNLWRIEDWAGRTRDGSTRSTRFAVLPRVWRRVCADRNSCHSRSCQLFSKCFYQASRRQTRAAHILVVNHALFFADLVLREKQGSVLPDYDAVVLDEAHRVEEVAGDHLGGRISPGQVEYLLNILYNPQTQKGVLAFSDAAPGRANRWLAGRAQKIFTQWDRTADLLSRRTKARIIVTGCPVRKEIFTATREDGLKKFALLPDKKTLLVPGGSQGAMNVNRTIIELLRQLDRFADTWQILHLTGPGKLDLVQQAYRQADVKIHYKLVDFTFDMPAALAAADLVLSRAGASSLAEFSARKLPAILMPYPYGRDQHQLANAKCLADAGAAVIVPDKCDSQANAASVGPVLLDLLADQEKLARMSAAYEPLFKPDAAAEIARQLLHLAGR